MEMKNRFSIKPTDVICLCTHNHLNSSVPFISACFVGAIPASLDPSLSLADTIHLLKQVTPKLIFVIPEAVQLIEDAIEKTEIEATIIVFGHTETHIPFEMLVVEKSNEEHFTPYELIDPKDTAVIFFSSGTTGFPKGICVSHCALLIQSKGLMYV